MTVYGFAHHCIIINGVIMPCQPPSNNMTSNTPRALHTLTLIKTSTASDIPLRSSALSSWEAEELQGLKLCILMSMRGQMQVCVTPHRTTSAYPHLCVREMCGQMKWENTQRCVNGLNAGSAGIDRLVYAGSYSATAVQLGKYDVFLLPWGGLMSHRLCIQADR